MCVVLRISTRTTFSTILCDSFFRSVANSQQVGKRSRSLASRI
nr:MAG TPA: hypothetical protein [Caudoviricetes sp.]